MSHSRKKLEETLKMDYKNIDKLFKDQLIKTKVCDGIHGEVSSSS